MMKSKHHRRLLITLAIPVAYGLAVGLMTYPAVLHLTDRLIGNNVDNWIFYWNNWWLEQALREGHNWFFTPYLFYPHGTSLLAHSNSFLNSLIAVALKPAVGPVAAYNLSLLLGLWLSGVGMFYLVHNLTGSPGPALLAGLVFTFAPYHLTQALAHTHLGSIQWWPFFALFLHRAVQQRRLVDGIWAGLFAGLTLWSGLQLGLLLGLWALLRIGWYALFGTGGEERGNRHRLRLWVVFALCAIVAILVSLPLLLPLLANWGQISDTTAFEEASTQQTDLLAYLVPPTYNPLVGSYVVPIYERFVANRALMPYLGYAVAGLGGLAFLTRKRETLFWACTGGLWATLAAGVVLRIGGRLHPSVPLPYRIVKDLFPLSAIRAPDRFNLLVVFSLAVVAGLGAAWLGKRRRRIMPLAVLLVALEYLAVPLPMWDLPPTSPFFSEMAHDLACYAVVDYPMDYTLSKLWLYYQTLHRKPLVEGHVSRYTSETYAFITSHPLLRALYQEAEKPPRLPAGEDSSPAPLRALGPALRSLEAEGVRYVLVHKPWLDARPWALFNHVLPLVPVYEDQTLAVYDIRTPLPYLYDGSAVSLGAEAALARFDVLPGEGESEWRIRVLTASRVSSPHPLPCQITLEGEDGPVSTWPIEMFAGQTAALVKGDLWLEDVALSLPHDLEAGTYRWLLSCANGGLYTSPDALVVEDGGRCSLLRRQMDLRYGEFILLEGYRWWTMGADLHLVLQWEALGRPTADYKVFVHLLDAGGEVVRQYDAMPCNWNCPTSQWQAGDIFPDQALISLWGLPPGEYRLAVGLYHPETLERLPVRGPAGAEYPDSYPILPGSFIIQTGPFNGTTDTLQEDYPTKPLVRR